MLTNILPSEITDGVMLGVKSKDSCVLPALPAHRPGAAASRLIAQPTHELASLTQHRLLGNFWYLLCADVATGA